MQIFHKLFTEFFSLKKLTKNNLQLKVRYLKTSCLSSQAIITM